MALRPYTSQAQWRRMRRDAQPLLTRTCTIHRWEGNGENATEHIVGTTIPYRRGMGRPGDLQANMGVLEAVQMWTLDFDWDVNLQDRDIVVDNADGMQFSPIGIVGDPERHIFQKMIAQVRK